MASPPEVPPFVADAFFGPILEERQRRERDPGYPAYPWLPDGRPTPPIEGHSPPVSFTVAACTKLPIVMNLDALRRSVLAALDGKPDTRTHAQRRSDDWAAYLKAKERYLGKTQKEEDGPGAAQEQAAGPAEEGAAPGAAGPDGDGGQAPHERADVGQPGGGPPEG